jgi:predicted ABC-class ATPase
LQRDADNGLAATERGRDDHIVCDRRRRVVGGVRQMGKKNINNNENKKKEITFFG